MGAEKDELASTGASVDASEASLPAAELTDVGEEDGVNLGTDAESSSGVAPKLDKLAKDTQNETQDLSQHKPQDETQDDERSSIFEVRLRRAAELKEQGNAAFKAQDWQSALSLYERGLYHSEFDEMQYNFELMDEHRAQVDEARNPLQLNAAACCLKLEEPRRAVDFCSEVLKVSPDHAKALFRRGQAHQALKDFEKAKADLVKAAKAAPQDKLVRKTLNEVLSNLKSEDEASRKLWASKMQQQMQSSPKQSDEDTHVHESESIDGSEGSSSRNIFQAAPSADSRGMCRRYVYNFLDWLGLLPHETPLKND